MSFPTTERPAEIKQRTSSLKQRLAQFFKHFRREPPLDPVPDITAHQSWPLTLRVLASMSAARKLKTVFAGIGIVGLVAAAFAMMFCSGSGLLDHPSDDLYRGALNVTEFTLGDQLSQTDDPPNTVHSWSFWQQDLPDATIVDFIYTDKWIAGNPETLTDPSALTPLNPEYDGDIFRFTYTASVDELRFMFPDIPNITRQYLITWRTIALPGLGHLSIRINPEVAKELIAYAEQRQSDTVTFRAIGSPDPAFSNPIIRAMRHYCSLFEGTPFENIVMPTFLVGVIVAFLLFRFWKRMVYNQAHLAYIDAMMNAENDTFGHW